MTNAGSGGLAAAIDDNQNETLFSFSGDHTENIDTATAVDAGNLNIIGDSSTDNTISLTGSEGISVASGHQLKVENVDITAVGTDVDSVVNAGNTEFKNSSADKINNTGTFAMDFSEDKDINTKVSGNTGTTSIYVEQGQNVNWDTQSGIVQSSLEFEGDGHLELKDGTSDASGAGITANVINKMTGNTLVLSASVTGDWTNDSSDSHAKFSDGASVSGTVTNDGTLDIEAGTYSIANGIVDSTATSLAGTLNIGDGTNASTVTLTSGNIKQKTLNILNNAKLVANAGNISLTDDIANAGTIELTGGNLASTVSGAGTTNISGDVDTNGNNISQATVNVGSSGLDASSNPIAATGALNVTGTSTVTTSGDINITSLGTVTAAADKLVASGTNGINNAGKLNLTGGNLASTVSGAGTTNISGDVDTNGNNISQATVNVGSSGLDASSNPIAATGTLTNNDTIIANDVNVTTSGTLDNYGDITADNINNSGTTNINGGTVTASTSVNNNAGTTNINSTVNTPVINANAGSINVNGNGDTKSSDKLANGTGASQVNIADGAKVAVTTNSANYSVDNAVTGTGTGTGELELNGAAGTARTASVANETQFAIDSAINNAVVSLASGQLNLPNENNLTNTTLNIGSGATLNTINGSNTTYNSNINFADNSEVKFDVDVSGKSSDSFANANEAGSEILTDVNIANLDKIVNNNTNIDLKTSSGLSGLVVSDELQGRKFQAMTPIRIMEATIGSDGMMNIHPSGGRNDWKSFNPSVLASPIAAQLGGYLTQLNSYDEAFRNMDMYMMMTKKQRQALKLRNKYAATSTDFVTFDPNQSMYENSAGWFRPYANFEKVNLKHGPKVSNVAYGSFFGGESEMKDLGHGWDGMWGAYVGYNGSHQAYNGISIYQNGGTLGAVGMAYKGDFFTGLTVNVGANAAEASTWYGSDNFSMLMAGVASKTGYNWELAHSKFIIQPSFLASYSFVNTFDYTNAAGVRINSDPLHAIQIEPGIKFIGNFENGWQPYVGVSMVWNIMDKTDFNANDIALPELSVKPFVKYGIGVRKTWGERFTGFFQTYFTNGGRNGVGLQAGFRWVVGKGGNSGSTASSKSNSGKKVVKEMTTKQKAAASGQKKVIKQLAAK